MKEDRTYRSDKERRKTAIEFRQGSLVEIGKAS